MDAKKAMKERIRMLTSSEKWKPFIEKSRFFVIYLNKYFKKLLSLFNFQRANSHFVGVEINQSNLKILQINSKHSPYKVEAFAIAPLPPGAMTNNEIKNHIAVGNALKEMFKQAGIQTTYVALAIPRSHAIIKNTTVDARLSHEDLESRAWIEANRHFPDLVGEINLDFIITGPSTNDPAQLDMVLVACRKDHIKPYLQVLHQAGLQAKVIDVNCYALERALVVNNQQLPPVDTVALLNLNVNLSTFIVLHKDNLIYSQDQSFNGERLLSQVNAYVNGDHVTDELHYQERLKENLFTFIQHTLHFFYSSRPNIKIQRILVAGDCASLPNLASFIQQEIGIEVRIANPFAAMEMDVRVKPDELTSAASTLVECCGLALSKLDKF